MAEGWRLPPLQVHQLYETMQRWSPIATSLPELVQRLVSIKQLHEQGGGQPHGESGHWGVGSPAPLPLVLGSDASPRGVGALGSGQPCPPAPGSGL